MPEVEKDAAALVMERYERAARSQMPVITEMEQARLFYRGDQWLKYAHRRWLPAPDPKWRVRLTVNKLPPIVELCIATLLRYKPIITATQATLEQEDRYIAKACEALLRYYWDACEFDIKLIELLTWVFVAGSGFLRVGWDPTKGHLQKRDVFDPKTNLQGTIMTPSGMPKLDVISPFSMSIEPGATRFDDAAWCIVTEIVQRAEVERKFNKRVDADDTLGDQLHIPMLLEREHNLGHRERCAYHQMYERPTRDFPEGRVIHVAGGQHMDTEEKLPKKQIRIAMFSNILLPGEFWPTSVVSQNVPLQMETNKGRSQLIENRNLCARPQLLAPEGSVEQGAFQARPGKIIYWDHIAAGGIPPRYLDPPQVPGWVMNLLGLTTQDMMDLASRHEASQGVGTSQITSGRHAEQFRSADDSRLGPSIKIFEHGLKSVGTFCLSEAQENLSGEQLVPIIGRGREGEAMRFDAAVIDDRTNVRFDIGSQLPWARESMKQQAIYLNQAGKMDDESLYQILELPDIQRVREHKQSHRLNARKENDRLREMYFPPLPTDDHRVHLAEHERDINAPENRDLYIAEMQQAQQQAQMAAQMGEQVEPPKFPPSLTHRLRHMDDHRNAIPAPQPPPPSAKINLNLDRLLQNPAVMANPQILAQIMPFILEMIRDTTGEPATPSNPKPPADGKARAPGVAESGIPTPPGGMDGGLYGPGASSGLGMPANVSPLPGGEGVGH